MAKVSAIEKRARILVEYGCVTPWPGPPGSVSEEETRWSVRSQTDAGASYSVTKDGENWKCTCPYFFHREVDRKHILAVRMFEAERMHS